MEELLSYVDLQVKLKLKLCCPNVDMSLTNLAGCVSRPFGLELPAVTSHTMEELHPRVSMS